LNRRPGELDKALSDPHFWRLNRLDLGSICVCREPFQLPGLGPEPTRLREDLLDLFLVELIRLGKNVIILSV
jgi:hypothetical protein